VWFWKFESKGFGKFWKSFGNSHKGILYEPWIKSNEKKKRLENKEANIYFED
jgi:hypothetical protein